MLVELCQELILVVRRPLLERLPLYDGFVNWACVIEIRKVLIECPEESGSICSDADMCKLSDAGCAICTAVHQMTMHAGNGMPAAARTHRQRKIFMGFCIIERAPHVGQIISTCGQQTTTLYTLPGRAELPCRPLRCQQRLFQCGRTTNGTCASEGTVCLPG